MAKQFAGHSGPKKPAGPARGRLGPETAKAVITSKVAAVHASELQAPSQEQAARA